MVAEKADFSEEVQTEWDLKEKEEAKKGKKNGVVCETEETERATKWGGRERLLDLRRRMAYVRRLYGKNKTKQNKTKQNKQKTKQGMFSDKKDSEASRQVWRIPVLED